MDKITRYNTLQDVFNDHYLARTNKELYVKHFDCFGQEAYETIYLNSSDIALDLKLIGIDRIKFIDSEFENFRMIKTYAHLNLKEENYFRDYILDKIIKNKPKRMGP